MLDPFQRRKFEVKSNYHELSILANSHFPWKSIWRTKAILRVAFFVWTAALGRILTLDNLRNRNVIVVDWGCIYKKSGESINHLLHYELARELCSLFHLLVLIRLCLEG